MNRNQYIIIGVLLLASFATGRFLTPSKVVTETKTVEVEKVVHDVVIKEKRIIVEVKNPDGSSSTTTTVDTNTQDHSTSESTAQTDTTHTTDYKKSSISINALGGVDITNPSNITYGLQFTKQWLGPIEIGVWGLIPSKTAGISIGLRF